MEVLVLAVDYNHTLPKCTVFKILISAMSPNPYASKMLHDSNYYQPRQDFMDDDDEAITL
ncbi:hypothetical protein CCR75_004871 [Bremia lactucae]|uniref:Uncharacterized protein n=1 Tax=Bremia lactucae TaxID=4779 RepID=A0A976NYG4_BRELC|nr:hypothetical protein CCR75_008482 [Bremia lactucae]TDH72521.1 hypothetical protein CCR75_004871 [Bremia lactucae]